MKAGTGAALATLARPDARAFDRWAQVYDAQLNPLLSLEMRKATPLLPRISGAHVLDVGCGTGRWLTHLEALSPASVTGADCSLTMLERAREKVRPTTKLDHADSSALPAKDDSYDFVMASFLLSYVSDLQEFARECARVLRSDGRMLISDMHPVTAAKLGWTRSFRTDGERVDIEVHSRSLAEIIDIFRQNGFEGRILIEPSFEEPEKLAFEKTGKLAEYEKLVGVPAIYILMLQKQRSFASLKSSTNCKRLQLTNARICIDHDALRDGFLVITDGRIETIRDSVDTTAQALDLSGYVLLPGLINAHEHLEFGLFPRLGRPAGAPCFQNSPEWAREIHQVHARVIERYRQIPQSTHLWWGAIRNLLCGVTTVCHHNPLHAELTLPEFPVRVLPRFGWSHSLAFDPDLVERFHASPREQPFIIHAAEGIDDESRNEVHQLDRMHALDEHTVLVHGLGCTAEEISLINRRGASLVVCPTSNRFLFGNTLSRELLTSVDRLSLGSDSPLTAAGDLLDEVRYLYAKTGLDPKQIYRMITTASAEMLHLRDGQGRLAESGVADLIAVPEKYDTHAPILSNLAFEDVELVLLGGRVQMASPRLYARLPYDLRPGMELIEVGGHQRWIRSPLQALCKAAEKDLRQEKLLLAGREVRYLGAL
ncbi:MAG TPA: methyltransferase domain-containing protein [Acidobacteriaceae bacterium]|nr:methyltransferase domain-containing protein [Acidobacteriaceae bacterium]